MDWLIDEAVSTVPQQYNKDRISWKINLEGNQGQFTL